MKTTKGKWVVDGSYITTGYKPTDEIICQFTNIESEYPTVNERSSEESFNNALLMAAAPEMYETLVEVNSLYSEIEKMVDDEVKEILNKVRKAIAKAEGK